MDSRTWFRLMAWRDNLVLPAEFLPITRTIVETRWNVRPPDWDDDDGSPFYPFRWTEVAAPTDDDGWYALLSTMSLPNPAGGHWPAYVFPETTVNLDGGGMYAQGQPVTEIPWRGLTVSVPSDHLPSLLDCCKTAEVATDVFRRYHVNGCRSGLILLEEDLPSLIAALEEAAPDAAARATAFWKERTRPELVLRRAQGLPDDLEFPTPEKN